MGIVHNNLVSRHLFVFELRAVPDHGFSWALKLENDWGALRTYICNINFISVLFALLPPLLKQ